MSIDEGIGPYLKAPDDEKFPKRAPERIWTVPEGDGDCASFQRTDEEVEYVRADLHADLEAERDAALEGKEIAEAWFDLVDENYKKIEAEVEHLQAAIQEE